METTKELWDTLEAKYITEDATSKKFLVSHFMKYCKTRNFDYKIVISVKNP